MKLRFIHTSDLQLGMTRHFLDPEDAGPRFAQERIDAIASIGDLARDTGAAFIVVAGDLFESNQLAPATVARAIDAMARLPVPIVILPGNHDPLDAATVYDLPAFAAHPSRIHVVRDATPFVLPGLDGVEIVGAPWRSKRPGRDLCADMLAGLAPVTRGVRVAVAHGQTDDLAPDPEDPNLIALAAAEAAVADGRIHYLALGDRHSTTEKGQRRAIWYSGAPVATDFDEVAPNQVLLVDLASDAPPVVTPHRVGRWCFAAARFRLDGDDELRAVTDWFDGHEDPARTIAKVAFEGSVTLRARARLDALLERVTHKYAAVRNDERRQDLVVVPDRFDADTLALAGYAQQAWQALLDGARGQTEQAQIDQDALALFYRLAGPPQ